MSTRKLASATVANLLIPLSGLVTSPFLSRELGPDGRGLYAALTLPIVVWGWLGTFGLQDSLAHHAQGGRLPRRAAAWVSVVAAVPLGLAGVALLGALGLFVFAGDSDSFRQYLVLALFAPLHVLAHLFIGALTGHGDVRGVNLTKVVPALVRTALVVGACLALDLSAFWAGLLLLASVAAGLVVALPRLLRGAEKAPGPARAERAPRSKVPVRSLATFALACLPGVLAGIATARLDQIVGLPLIGAEQLGYYAVAVSVAELPMVMAVAARTVLMGGGLTDDPRRAARPARLAMLGSFVTSVLLAAVAPTAVPVFFGAPFGPAVLPTVILCGATILYTGTLVVTAALLVDGRPGRSSTALVIGSAAGLALLLALAPLGAVGAAIAGVAGYGVSFAVAAGAVVRGRPPSLDHPLSTLRRLTIPYRDDMTAVWVGLLRTRAVAGALALARRAGPGTVGVAVLVVLAWARTVVPGLVQMLTDGRPGFNKDFDAVPGAELLGDAISLAFILVAATMIVVGAVVGRRSGQWPWLAVAVAPLAAIAVSGLVNDLTPSLVAVALPLAVVAIWMCPPGPLVLPWIGLVGAVSAAGSMLLAAFRPDLALLSGTAAGAKADLPGGLLAGPYPHSNVLAIGLALSLPFLFEVRRRWLRWSALAIVVAGVAWTGARTAQAAVAAVLVAHLLARYPRARRRSVRTWPLSTAASVGALLIVALPALTRDPEAFTRRGRIWQVLLDLWRERPVFGWGLGLFDRPETAVLGGLTHGHNIMVHLLGVGGLLATTLFAGLVAVAWWRSVALARTGRPAALLYLVALCLVSVMEASYLSTTLTGYLAWLPLALIVRSEPDREAAVVSQPPAEGAEAPRPEPDGAEQGQNMTVSRR